MVLAALFLPVAVLCVGMVVGLRAVFFAMKAVQAAGLLYVAGCRATVPKRRVPVTREVLLSQEPPRSSERR